MHAPVKTTELSTMPSLKTNVEVNVQGRRVGWRVELEDRERERERELKAGRRTVLSFAGRVSR